MYDPAGREDQVLSAELDGDPRRRSPMLRGRPREVDPLPGGLTNRNYKVDDGGRRLRRAGVPRRRRRCWRSTASTSTATRSSRPRPASARRSSTTCPSDARAGRRLHRRRDVRPTDVAAANVAAGRRGLPAAARGGAFVTDFDMFDDPAPLPAASCRTRGFRLPDRLPRPRSRRSSASVRALRRATPSRPCRATTTCWPATSSTTASRSGSSTTSTPATTTPASSSATSGASATSTTTSSTSSSRPTTAGRCPSRIARAKLQGLMSQLRLDVVGVDPGRDEPASTSTSGRGAWRSTTRAERCSRGPEFGRLLDDVQRRRTDRDDATPAATGPAS